MYSGFPIPQNVIVTKSVVFSRFKVSRGELILLHWAWLGWGFGLLLCSQRPESVSECGWLGAVSLQDGGSGWANINNISQIFGHRSVCSVRRAFWRIVSDYGSWEKSIAFCLKESVSKLSGKPRSESITKLDFVWMNRLDNNEENILHYNFQIFSPSLQVTCTELTILWCSKLLK